VTHEPCARHEDRLDRHRGRAESLSHRREAGTRTGRRPPCTGRAGGRRRRAGSPSSRPSSREHEGAPKPINRGSPRPGPPPAPVGPSRRSRRGPSPGAGRSRPAAPEHRPRLPRSSTGRRGASVSAGRDWRRDETNFGEAAATSIARSCEAVRCAPGLSPLLTTTMSATSSNPALIAWTSSPISGASRTTVVSAAAATSTSLWPVPTVSTSTMSNPAASSTAAAAPVDEASPPAWPRAAMERMKTPSSPAYACIRTRSPRSAPPVIGDDGSTAMTATDRPTRRSSAIRAATRVDFPAPGGPVIPTRWADPASE